MIPWIKTEHAPKTITVFGVSKKGELKSKEEPIAYLAYCTKNKSYHKTFWVEDGQRWSMFTKENPPQYLSELTPPISEQAL
jgi:hypothetical protein